MVTSSNSERRLFIAGRFALAGTGVGAVISLILYEFAGPRTYPAVLGFEGTWHFFILPIFAGAVAGVYGLLAALLSPSLRKGKLIGSFVGVSSFVTSVSLLSIYVAGRDFLEVLGGFLLFGGIFFGWTAVLIGAWVGASTKRGISKNNHAGYSDSD